MGMGTSYLKLDIVICGMNQRNEEIVNRLFPTLIEPNIRKLERKDDNILLQQKFNEDLFLMKI